MKDASTLDADSAMNGLAGFDTIIDVRSPDEFEHDRLPGAINLPVLSNAERELIGTINAQDSAFAAKRQGAALVAANIGRLIGEHLADKPPGWKPLVYCWRGGNRSGSLATVLSRIGWRTTVLEGGYRAYRRWVISQIDKLAPLTDFHVIAGRTGSGKSLLLQELSDMGRPVLDLEGLANHRGSVLGLLPDDVQPSQKQFESRLAKALAEFNDDSPVYVESESRKIGQVQIPNALITQMRSSTCTVLNFPVPVRAEFLIRHYAHFLQQPELLLKQLRRLYEMHGEVRIETWATLADTGQWNALVTELLTLHYDPAYDRSMKRNYHHLDQASIVSWPDGAPATLADANAESVIYRSLAKGINSAN